MTEEEIQNITGVNGGLGGQTNIRNDQAAPETSGLGDTLGAKAGDATFDAASVLTSLIFFSFFS